MSNLSELLAKKAALEQQILEAQREQRSQAIAQVRALTRQSNALIRLALNALDGTD